MALRIPTPDNIEVIPCLIIVDQAGVESAKFKTVIEMLNDVIKKQNSKLRVGLIVVGDTINPPQDVKFLAPIDWNTFSLSTTPVQATRYPLVKAILMGLWEIRKFALSARSEAIRVFPPLVYVLTQRLPQDDAAITKAVAAYTYKATHARRMVMKWFYVPTEIHHASIEMFKPFVAKPQEDVIEINDDGAGTQNLQINLFINYISQSIQSHTDSISLPTVPSDVETEEDELAYLMTQHGFKP
jgi:hypothetical protein